MPAESQQTVESTDPARQNTILLAVLLYSAWFIYTHRAKHSGALWGHRFAAQFAAWVCQRIGQACGLTFTVKFDSDAADLSTGTRGMIATVGPHGVFPLATLGFGTFKFRSDVGRFEDPHEARKRVVYEPRALSSVQSSRVIRHASSFTLSYGKYGTRMALLRGTQITVCVL